MIYAKHPAYVEFHLAVAQLSGRYASYFAYILNKAGKWVSKRCWKDGWCIKIWLFNFFLLLMMINMFSFNNMASFNTVNDESILHLNFSFKGHLGCLYLWLVLKIDSSHWFPEAFQMCVSVCVGSIITQAVVRDELDESVSCWTVMTWITFTQRTDVSSTSNIVFSFMYHLSFIIAKLTGFNSILKSICVFLFKKQLPYIQSASVQCIQSIYYISSCAPWESNPWSCYC